MRPPRFEALLALLALLLALSSLAARAPLFAPRLLVSPVSLSPPSSRLWLLVERVFCARPFGGEEAWSRFADDLADVLPVMMPSRKVVSLFQRCGILSAAPSNRIVMMRRDVVGRHYGASRLLRQTRDC